MTEPEQSPLNLASHQPDTQAKEAAVIGLICLLRLMSQPLASAIQASPGTDAAFAASLVYSFANNFKPYLLIIAASTICYLGVMCLANRSMSRRVLDVIGVVYIVFMLLQFVKINLLLISNAGPANVLLIEALIYIAYFAIMWGWILWRIDAATKPATNTVIALDSETPPTTMFDYYHASIQSVMHPARVLSIRGLTTFGRNIILIRNFMMLDLYAVVLGRFYQLIQKVV